MRVCPRPSFCHGPLRLCAHRAMEWPSHPDWQTFRLCLPQGLEPYLVLGWRQHAAHLVRKVLLPPRIGEARPGPGWTAFDGLQARATEALVEAFISAAVLVHAGATCRADWPFNLLLEWHRQRQIGPLAMVDRADAHRHAAPRASR